MKIGPYTIDIDAISTGILEMIDDHPDGACLRLGMLPAGIMESFERNLQAKIPAFYIWEGREYLDGAEIREDINHAVVCAVLRKASASGKCLA